MTIQELITETHEAMRSEFADVHREVDPVADVNTLLTVACRVGRAVRREIRQDWPPLSCRTTWALCVHANEVPRVCPCVPECICRAEGGCPAPPRMRSKTP